jgi:gliding motility-associated-like protein
MWVYDRWGVEIFYTNDHEYGWDGKIDKKDGNNGVYYYIVKYTSRCHLDMEPVTKTGFVHLQR